MQKALHIRTTVQPGGKIEIVDRELTEGESVDVVVTRSSSTGKVVYHEFDQKPSKPIVDKIDRVLAEHYGFTEEERLHYQL